MSTPEQPEPLASFRRRVLRGTFYVGAGSWTASAFGLVSQLIIARLIGPSEIGLYAFVFAIAEFVNILAALSIGVALIQARDESEELYDTALVLAAAVGLVGLVISLMALPFLWETRTPRAGWFLLWMTLGRAVQLLAEIPLAKLQRHIRYGNVGMITIASRILANAAAIGVAWSGFGGWSLVWRDVITMTLTFVLACAWSGYRFRGRVRRDPAQRLLRYAGPMMLSRGTDILTERVDRLAIGALLGNTATGLYHQALYLSQVGAIAIQPVMGVSLNLYARLQDAPQRLTRAYALTNYFLARFSFLLSAPFLVYPEETIRLLLGEDWISAAPLLRWLAFYCALSPLLDNIGNLFYAVDHVGWVVRIRVVQLAVFTPAVLVACSIGRLDYVAAAVVAYTALGLVLSWNLSPQILTERVRVLRVPLFTLACTATALLAPFVRDLADQVPWFGRPFLAGACFVAVLVAVDRRQLITELRYLYDQL